MSWVERSRTIRPFSIKMGSNFKCLVNRVKWNKTATKNGTASSTHKITISLTKIEIGIGISIIVWRLHYVRNVWTAYEWHIVAKEEWKEKPELAIEAKGGRGQEKHKNKKWME